MTDFSNLKYYEPGQKEADPKHIQADLCIYGGTSAGVAAAVQARRMGLSAVIAEFGHHLGGMTSSGLGGTDIGNKDAIGGISREFYRALGKHYGEDEMWTFEPHAAERIYNEWVQEAGIEVYFAQYLDQVHMNQGRIQSITMENGNRFTARAFIDATYEGDLMARAGVSYHVGREANATYRETLNGIQFGSPHHNFKAWIDPYNIEGKPDSGLVPCITEEAPGYQGQGDRALQAYNFRICLTNNPEIRMPFPKPPNYDPKEYTLLARYLKAGIWDALKLHKMMPNQKTDLNNFGGYSTDHIGANHGWADGNYAVREKIYQSHVTNNMGMLYFLANDDQVPQYVRDEVNQWGLPANEFPDTAGWPHQLYIREARRMISEVVMTEHDCRGFRAADDPVGLAAYQMDSHNARRIVIDGRATNEGDVQVAPSEPYPISYRAIIPKGEECTNLLVPVCLSASHIAFGSIRMEPVFMILGQSAATAAALALEADVDIQDVPYSALRERLLEDKQVLDWKK